LERNLVDPPAALTDQVFACLVGALETVIGTEEFPHDRVDHATSQFIAKLKYLSKVYVQDLAFMYEKMKNNPAYGAAQCRCVCAHSLPDFSLGFAPFNTPEFLDFVEELRLAIAAVDPKELQETAAAARARGEVEMAAFAEKCIAAVKKACGATTASAAPAPTRGVQLARTPNQMLTQLHQHVLGPGAALPATPTRPAAEESLETEARESSDEPPADVPRLTTDRSVNLRFGVRHFDIKDTTTWPQDPVDLPGWIKSVDMTPVLATVTAVAREWLHGRDDHSPRIKDLEDVYGPDKRKISWRSPAFRGNSALSNLFNKRKDIYKYLDTVGESEEVAVWNLNEMLRLEYGDSEQSKRRLDKLNQLLRLRNDANAVQNNRKRAKKGTRERTAAAEAKKAAKKAASKRKRST